MKFGSNLEGKVVVVTGASRGIGRGLAAILAEEGAHLALCARSVKDLESLASELGPNCRSFALDLRDLASIRGCFSQIEDEMGSIDVLVNNAGMGSPKAALDISEEEWDWMMDLNLKGTFFCCQEAGRRMVAQRGGRIINISSQASVVAIPGEAVYCASKGGLNMLTKTLAVEWAAHNVTVNAVGPTFVYTPGTAERLEDPEFSAAILSKIPRSRFATIEDVASAVLYLASDSSSMVTGTLLLVDGGWTAL